MGAHWVGCGTSAETARCAFADDEVLPLLPDGVADGIIRDVAVAVDPFIEFAALPDVVHRTGLSSGGLPERYLYCADMVYRYAFGRWWGEPTLGATAVWVLLNPATGDTEQRRRPTLERCIRWSREAGHAGIVIVNLFAFRATDPRDLRVAADPVGPRNDAALSAFTAAGARSVVAWGSHGRLHRRSSQVGPLLTDPMCLGTTRSGEPRHPLYVPGGTALVPWTAPAST